MFNVLCLCCIGFLAATNPAMADANAVAGGFGFDWNHLLQICFTALAAYFGSRQSRE